MHCDIHIDCKNAAFDENPSQEVGRILLKLAARIMGKGLLDVPIPIMDINGNTTGEFLFWED